MTYPKHVGTVETREKFNKLGLALIFDPAITTSRATAGARRRGAGVDGCQLNLSVTQPAQTPTTLISILAEQHVDLRIVESNLYANDFNLDDFVTLIRLAHSKAPRFVF